MFRRLRPSRAIVAYLAVLASAVVLVQAQAPLPGHSIILEAVDKPWSAGKLDDMNGDWLLAGTVIPNAQSIVLQPGVPNRLGFMWSRFPLLTNDFEVSFEITCKAPAERSVKDDGFAFWYVNENATEAVDNISSTHLHNQEEIIANTWTTAFSAQELDLFGYRSKFDGVGVFFTNGGQNKDKPTVSGLSSDGKTPYNLNMGIPTTDAMQYDFRSGNKVQIKMRFRPLGVKIEIVGGPSQDLKVDVKAGGYIGLSVFGGNKGKVEASERSDFVQMYNLNVVNYDTAAKGEDIPKVVAKAAPVKTAEEKEDIIHSASSFKDHRKESEAIKELTNMVFKLVVESQPMRTQMLRAIESLGKRVTVMEKSFEGLKLEIDKRTGHKLGEEFDAIKRELTSLSNVASTETQEQKARLDSLHEDIAHVHKSATSQDNIDHHLNKLTESNKQTIENLTSQHQRSFGVSIVAIVFIVVAGFSLYHKFRCWEKKHVL